MELSEPRRALATMLKANALSKSYGSSDALCNLNLSVEPGEVVGLLGANGAGKSTTLNIFLGFVAPSSGSASVGGIDVVRDPVGARARIAFVPEVVALYPHLSGLENVDYFVRLTGREDPQRADLLKALATVGLPAAAADRRASTYSKGMRQKVALAIALARRAEALLLDEPLSGLDPSAANEFVASVRDAGDRGMAVLMATHDVFRAKECAHRVGILKGGRLVDLRSTDSLSGAQLEELYLEHMRS